MKRLYRIIPQSEWERVCEQECFAPADLLAGGFIHLCTPAQLSFVLERHFAGAQGLHVLEIDAEAIAASLRWETSEPAMPPFPHCYGPIPRSAILTSTPIT